MITYLAHSLTTSLEDIVVYKYENNSLLLTESLNFKDLAAFVTDQSQFIFLLSSSDVSSYSIDGDNENNLEATFVSSKAHPRGFHACSRAAFSLQECGYRGEAFRTEEAHFFAQAA